MHENPNRRMIGNEWATRLHRGFIDLWQLVSGHLVVTKKDAVALWIYVQDKDEVILVEQYRPAAGTQLIEVVAGHIEPKVVNITFNAKEPAHASQKRLNIQLDDSIRQTMVSEAQQEVGARVDHVNIEFISGYGNGFFSSPGFTTERLYLGFVALNSADIENYGKIPTLIEYAEFIDKQMESPDRTYGVAEENEATFRRRFSIREVERFVRDGLFVDLKTLTLAQWFLYHKYPHIFATKLDS